MRTRRPEHLTTFDYSGFHRYFLTFCTFERNRIFVTADRVDLVRTQFVRACSEEAFVLLAYCFMPDHVHLLVAGASETADCRRFIARAKQYAGFYFRKSFGQQLWQRYGFEHSLREEDATLSVIRYIVENPLRARLVASVLDYPFVGSGVYTLKDILEAVQIQPAWRRSG